MDEHNVPPGRIGDRPEDNPIEDSASDGNEWSPDWEEQALEEPSLFSLLYLPIILFIVTVFTTLWAGAYQVNTQPVKGVWDFLVRYPENLFQGWPFAATLLGILVTHEFGHFWLSRIHRVPASLPMFIPGPPQFIGTFGAIIRMRSPIMNRRALFDIGVAGPIAGFVVAVVALFIGLSMSTVVPKIGLYGLQLGEPLLLQFFAWLVFGPIPETYDIVLHPVGFAAWFGLFVTALNLLPVGQLDGGHVAFALFGRRQRTLAFVILPILVVLGIWGWPGWLLWAGLTVLVGIAHPPVIDPSAELGSRADVGRMVRDSDFYLMLFPGSLLFWIVDTLAKRQESFMEKRNAHLESYIRTVRPQFEDLLAQMVETPSISSDPERVKDIHRTATLGMQFLKSFGAQARVVKTGGYPVVSGGWQVGKQYPTLTIYNHLDVQPAQEPEWRQEPFQFRKEGNRYRGRGTTDDKGPALTALLAAHYAVEQGVPLNIQFLWELEEEIGSPNFQDALDQKKSVPRPDSVLISDTIWVSRQKPAIPTGLRGLLSAQLSLRTGTTDVHSGLTGGGARNPLAELCDAAHACVDARTGRVKIPGFYAEVQPPTSKEMKEFLSSGFQVNQFKKAFGFRAIRTEDRANLIKRIWAAPTFEVHGLVGGHIGYGVKTVVPPLGQLKVSMRLVPNQNPQKIYHQLKAFLKKHNPDIQLECDGQLEPFRGVTGGPYAHALRKAVQAGFGKTPSFVREGGSIGAVKLMERAWKVPILFMGLSLPEHGYHAPNEFFDWGQASGGMRAFVEYFSQVAHMRDG